MKVWKELIQIEGNESYDIYKNPSDVLQNYRYAIVDTSNGIILAVHSDLEELKREYDFKVFTDYELSYDVILEIETDIFSVPEMKIVWTKTTKVHIG